MINYFVTVCFYLFSYVLKIMHSCNLCIAFYVPTWKSRKNHYINQFCSLSAIGDINFKLNVFAKGYPFPTQIDKSVPIPKEQIAPTS